MPQFDWGIQIQAAVFKKWQATGGGGVKIAVLDTGVDLGHPAMKHLALPGHRLNAALPGFDPSQPQLHGNADVADAFRMKGHGTQCLSVISAKAAGADALLGLAPLAEVFIFKVNTVDNKFFRVKDFLRGLEAAANLGVDLIVASLTYPPGDIALEQIPQAEVDRVFARVQQSGALLLASLPNMNPTQAWTGIAGSKFPTLRQEAIKVGVVSQAILDNWGGSIDAEPGVDFLVSNAIGHFCKIKGEYVQEPLSSSYATYLVAGIGALFLASQKKTLRLDYKPLLKADFVKGVSQRFVKLSNAAPIVDATPVFFKKTNPAVIPS